MVYLPFCILIYMAIVAGMATFCLCAHTSLGHQRDFDLSAIQETIPLYSEQANGYYYDDYWFL